MRTLKKLLLLAAAAVLSGCVYETYPPHPPHHPGPGGSHNQSSHYYREGRSAGERDARRGLSQSPSRHWSRVPGVYRTEFTRGYNQGYRDNSGHRPGGGHHGESARYHQSGYDHGVRDRSRGLSNNPGRHSGRVPRQYIRDFNRGYDSGWNAGGRPGWPRR